MPYNDASQDKFFRQDVQQKAKVVSEGVISTIIKVFVQIIKAIGGFLGDMVKQFLGK